MASEAPDGTRAGAARVVLADDDVLLREGLASLLERSGFEVVGQADTAPQLIELVRVLSADVEVEHAMDLLASGQRTGYLL